MITKADLHYFSGSTWFTAFSLIAAGSLGFYYTGTVGGAASMMMITAILGVLEVSLSFDNAVVNAKVLKDMDPVWQHRFITWGMVIAVFGMRVVFPLLIVGIAASIGPIQAVVLAATNPAEYERILSSAHLSVAFFGGTFLLMVGLDFFFDAEKDVHWVKGVETFLNKIGGVKLADALVALVIIVGFGLALPAENFREVVLAGVGGLITYGLVKSIDMVIGDGTGNTAKRTGAAAFLYLEVLDASFSFDGVIGAFALTNNMFIIALGLGIGAFFVRSLTLLMVDKGTLDAFKYLEHGAFWAILSLAACMFAGTVQHIPEWFTGLIGATFIGLAIWSSVGAVNDAEEDADDTGVDEADFARAQDYLAVLSGLRGNGIGGLTYSPEEVAAMRESFKRLGSLDADFDPELVMKLSGTAV